MLYLLQKPTCRVQILVIMPGKRVDSPQESEAKAVCVWLHVNIRGQQVKTYRGAKAEYAMRMTADKVVFLGVQVCSLHQRHRVICSIQFPNSP